MTFDFYEVKELYGENIIKSINDKFDDVLENVDYLSKIGVKNIPEIFNKFAIIFLSNSKTFQTKIDDLVKTLGSDYVEKLELDMSLWMTLM